MPTFIFQGRNSEGVQVTGKRLSQSIDTLGNQLIKEGIIPIKITPEKTEDSGMKFLKEFLFYQKPTTDELAIFCRQMHTLVKAGVPLTAGIRQLAESTQNQPLSNALFGIVEDLEGGQDLARAMQSYPKVFTPLIINMVRVGQNSGRLDEIFLNLYHFLELESVSIKRTKTVLRYPMIVSITIIIAIILINIFVIPAFSRAYAKTNLALPRITQILMAISSFTLDHWFLILCIIAFLVGAFLYEIKTPKGRLAWHRFLLRIPAIGSILKRIILLRFAQTFAVVVNSGIPLVDGLALVASTIPNEYVRGRILVMQTEIQRGKSLTQAAATANVFTPLELQMLAVSEETGALGAMLDQIASVYQREVDYDLKRLTDIIEPVLIFGLSIFVLLLALAVYLPIWNMIKMVKP